MPIISYFIWNADPVMFDLSVREVRWYGLLFALGFLISQQIMYYIYKKEGKPTTDVDTLTVYLVLATIIGARLGHVFFYEPDKFLKDPVRIIKFWEGGLASHGAAIAILIALYIYSRYEITFKNFRFTSKRVDRKNQSYLQVLDRIVIVIALTGCLIRVGNLMNSEIYGVPTKSNFGFVYAHHVTDAFLSSAGFIEEVQYQQRSGDPLEGTVYRPITIKLQFSRRSNYSEEEYILFMENSVNSLLGNFTYVREHIYEPLSHPLDYKLTNENNRKVAEIYTYAIPRVPTQILEATSYLIIFIILFLVWNKHKLESKPGFIFGLFLVILWSARFGLEFLKENQVAFEETLPLNMGQWLSLPLILTGIYLLLRKR